MKERKRNTFVFNEDWGESIDNAPQEEREPLYRAIRKYAIYNEDTELPPYSSAIMSIVKQQIDRNKQKYEEVRQKRIEAGRKGNSQRWGDKSQMSQMVASVANASKCSQMVANVADNVNGNGNVNGIIIDNDDNNKKNKSKKESRFKPPTIEEIVEYAKSKGYEYVDAESFWNFYESKGWMVGKNKMKKWHSAVANWNKTEKEQKLRYGSNTGINGKNREEYLHELQAKQIASAPKPNVGTTENGGGEIQTEIPFD